MNNHGCLNGHSVMFFDPFYYYAGLSDPADLCDPADLFDPYNLSDPFDLYNPFDPFGTDPVIQVFPVFQKQALFYTGHFVKLPAAQGSALFLDMKMTAVLPDFLYAAQKINVPRTVRYAVCASAGDL